MQAHKTLFEFPVGFIKNDKRFKLLSRRKKILILKLEEDLRKLESKTKKIKMRIQKNLNTKENQNETNKTL